MVWPLMTVVIGELPGPMVNVWPAITASDAATENVNPPAVTVEKFGSAGGSPTVVVARPTPLGPMLMVWPLMTVVIGALPGPIVNVWPAITASDAATEKVNPPAVTVEKVGSA